MFATYHIKVAFRHDGDGVVKQVQDSLADCPAALRAGSHATLKHTSLL